MSLGKNIIIGLIALVLLTNKVSAKLYPDVPVNHKHHTAINAISDKGIVKGYPNGEFHPDGLINRAEAVKIMTKSLFDSNKIDSSLDWHIKANHSYAIFPDTPISQWFAKYVETAYQENVIQGYPDNSFRPANSINFAEALKVILESYKVDLNSSTYKKNDLLIVEQGTWYEKYFSFADQYNLLDPNKVYHPGQLITRGEFVEIIYRLENVLDNDMLAFQDPTPNSSNEYTITIPKLNIINVNVNFANLYDENSALETIKNGLGHYLKPPDKSGKKVLFGHSSGYSWDDSAYKTILRNIDQLKNGDRIYLNYKEKGYVYEIFSYKIIPATEDYQIVENSHLDELALYTCWPPNSVQKRYVVYGKPI